MYFVLYVQDNFAMNAVVLINKSYANSTIVEAFIGFAQTVPNRL